MKSTRKAAMSTIGLNKRPEVKYQKVADGLRDSIRRGILKPGDRLPSLSEMNERHNLSRTTMERVHRMLESDGLVVREQGRGTFVASPNKRTNGLIGFSGHGFKAQPRPPYWASIMEGLQQSAAREGQGVVLLDIETFTGWDQLDGLVLAERIPESSSISEKIPTLLPCVYLLLDIPGQDCVVVNDYQGGQLAAEHLISFGHKRIACLMDSHKYPVNRRFSGYRDALSAAGIQFDERWLRYYSLPDRGVADFIGHSYDVMQQWLSEDWHELGCTALVLQNDLVGVGVLKALQESGISVPEQVSVVGFDGIDVCDYLSPRLTSVEVPLQEIAMRAMETLLHQIEHGPRLAATTVLPVQMQIRESTAPAPW